MSGHKWILISIVSLGALAACEPPPEKGDEEEQGITASVSERIPTVVTVSWTTEEPTYGAVEFGLEGAFDQRTPDEQEPTTEHSVVVLGLKAGETYDLRAVSTDEVGESTTSEPVSVSLAPPPAELTRISVTGSSPTGGYILTSVIQSDHSWVVILDRDGDYVWYLEVADDLVTPGARFDANTNSVFWMPVDNSGDSDVAVVRRAPLDDSEWVDTRAVLGHHDAVLHPDGTVGWLSFDFRDVPYEDSEIYVAADLILEAPEGSDEEVAGDVVFPLLDHIPFREACEHVWEILFKSKAYDFSHGNSLLYDAEEDAYWLLTRNLDSILVVDRATGALTHRIGGEGADLTVSRAEDAWSHGHMSHRWDGGFMLFDNGYHHDPQASRVLEYAYDLDAGTLELVWEFHHAEPMFNEIFGDAQKLGDSYLVSWSAYGRLEEISSEGESLWRADTEIGFAIGRVEWVEDLYDLSAAGTF